MRYKKQYDGNWIFPKRDGFKLMCCDCGLVHRLRFVLVRRGKGHRIAFQPFRDRRATAAARRARRRPAA